MKAFILHRFRILIWLILATLVFTCFLLISIARHEAYLRQQRERRFMTLLRAQESQDQRKSHITRTCQRLYGPKLTNISALKAHLTAIKSSLDHLIVDEANRLIYCFVPKVASTNWKRVLLALINSRRAKKHSSQDKNAQDNQLDPLYYKGNESHLPTAFTTLSQYQDVDRVIRILATHLKFMFVRHPYERLLSAYRNKLEHAYSDYFRLRFGRKIVKQLRGSRASNESIEKGDDVTFEEFLTYLTQLNVTDHKRDFNEHWRPVADLCLPCLVDYDVVGKYETLVDDAQLVLWKARVPEVVRFPKREDTYSNQPSAELMMQYFGNMSKELMEKIRAIYDEDMQMFEYSSYQYEKHPGQQAND